MQYFWDRLVRPLLRAVPIPLLTEFGINHRLESYAKLFPSTSAITMPIKIYHFLIICYTRFLKCSRYFSLPECWPFEHTKSVLLYSHYDLPGIRKFNMNWNMSLTSQYHFQAPCILWEIFLFFEIITISITASFWVLVVKRCLQNYFHLFILVSWNVHDDFLCMSVGPLHILGYCCCAFAIAAKCRAQTKLNKNSKMFLGFTHVPIPFSSPSYITRDFLFLRSSQFPLHYFGCVNLMLNWYSTVLEHNLDTC